MVPLFVFGLLILMLIGLMLYSFLDHQNRIYANIIAAFLAAILAAYLGTLCWTDTVYESSCCCYNETASIYNASKQEWHNTTEYLCHTEQTFSSPSLTFFFLLVSFVMFGYTILMALEAIAEYQTDKKLRIEAEKEGRI